ncbi:hypothetical protein [Flagellimonas beolgyonensis]|uniref:hypothetical protein n=1 Tax=Flagellimonas beolgyonensis TaxID=864064 RepID=UPI000F8E1033|nr:hypothetical protein [Allomuricauda beolgyonensis]
MVKRFVDDIIVSGDVGKIEEYLDLGTEVKSNPDYLIFFKEYFKEIRGLLDKGCDFDYDLLTFEEAKKSDVKSIEQYEKYYSHYEQVFFIICNDQITLPLIVENDKIISFQSKMLKKYGGDYSPFLLNK